MGKRAKQAPISCAGVLATACTQGRRWQHGKPDSVVGRREVEIVKLLSQGLSNQAIADHLILSLGTVKWYSSQIYGKLGVRSRTQAVALCRELGLAA